MTFLSIGFFYFLNLHILSIEIEVLRLNIKEKKSIYENSNTNLLFLYNMLKYESLVAP